MSTDKFEHLEVHSDTRESLVKRLDSISMSAKTLLSEVRDVRGYITEQSIFEEKSDILIPDGGNFHSEVEKFEIGLIEEALQLSNGNRSRAARHLSLKVSTLNSKIKRYGLSVESYQDFDIKTVG